MSKQKKQKSVQLTIAAYGKQRHIPKYDPFLNHEIPVVLSLPVTDQMEDKLSPKNTLDCELTEYTPMVQDQAPRGLISGTEGMRFNASTSSSITVDRCEQCYDQAGPCKPCQDKFNQQMKKSLDAYELERQEQDNAILNTTTNEFTNPIISDKPLPKDFTPPEYDENEVLRGFVQDETLSPQGFPEGGWETDSTDLTKNPHVVPPISTIKQKNSPTTEIERLNQQIKHLKDKLEKTSLCISLDGNPECMWHLEPFDGPVIQLPIRYNELTKQYESMGCFCSFECAYAYRLEHRSAEAAPLSLLFQAYRQTLKENKKAYCPLIPAPPRQKLKRWGGTQSIKEFLKNTQGWIHLVRNPFISTKQYTESMKINTAPINIQTTHKFNPESLDGLLRKRNKPHPNAVNQWDAALRRSKLRR